MSRRYKTLQAAVDGTEAQFQKAVVEFAERYGWKVAHTPDQRRSPASMVGYPDLVLYPPKDRYLPILFRELKTPSGRLTQEQEEWGRYLKSLKADWGVWRPEHWPQIKRILEGPALDF